MPVACLLCAKLGHSRCLNSRRNVAHRDAGGGAVHSITSGRECGISTKLGWPFPDKRLGCVEAWEIDAW
jgi:hypothetical protein